MVISRRLKRNRMDDQAIPRTDFALLSDGWKSAGAGAPLVGAMLLDLADLLSLGPQALPLALFVAAPLGWAIARGLGLSRNWRLASALVAGADCLVPGTGLIPAATVTSLLAQLVSWKPGSAIH